MLNMITYNVHGYVCQFVRFAGPWFSVEGKNEERGVSGVSYLRKLYVTVNGITVTLMKTRKTLVSKGHMSTPLSSMHTQISCIILYLFLILHPRPGIFRNHILIRQHLSLFNAIIPEMCVLSMSLLSTLLICLANAQKVGFMRSNLNIWVKN